MKQAYVTTLLLWLMLAALKQKEPCNSSINETITRLFCG
jgi:hypothetical protein